MIRLAGLAILLILSAACPGMSIFVKDPATANSLGASAAVLNTTSNTFTRATSAYDPNADAIVGSGVRRQRNQVIGTTTYAMDLIEGQRTNLLAAGTSERFDQWTAVAGGTVTADTTAAPNGEVIAQTLTDPGASLSGVSQAVTVANDSLLFAASIYVKKTSGGTAPTFGATLELTGGTPVTVNARINTDTGAQQYGSNANTTVVNADSTYWRVIVIITNNTSGNVTLTESLYPAAAAFAGSVDDATATGTAICTFADLNKSAASSTSTFASSYASNRNVLLQTEALNTTWTKTRCTITSDSTANPIDGATNADTIVDDNTAANTHFIGQSFTKPNAAIQMEFSTYIKQSGVTWALVQCSDTGITNGAGIYFDVANGVKGTAVALGAGWTLDASTITAVGSYYRCTVTVTTAVSTTIRSEVYTATGDLLAIHNGINAAALICWGNQLVYGAKPQTYWAVTTASGLRAADLLTSTLTVSAVSGTLISVCRPYGWALDQDGVSIYKILSATVTAGNCEMRRGSSVGSPTTISFVRNDAGGAEGPTGASLTQANGTNATVGMTWGAAAVTGYVNGPTNGTPDTTLTPPYNAVAGIGIGFSPVTNVTQFYGYVLGFYWDATVLPPSSMQIFANGVAP